VKLGPKCGAILIAWGCCCKKAIISRWAAIQIDATNPTLLNRLASNIHHFLNSGVCAIDLSSILGLQLNALSLGASGNKSTPTAWPLLWQLRAGLSRSNCLVCEHCQTIRWELAIQNQVPESHLGSRTTEYHWVKMERNKGPNVLSQHHTFPVPGSRQTIHPFCNLSIPAYVHNMQSYVVLELKTF
jgi:hypothetical protein